ncbi:DsbE family thiol:disulfide interchange protein [Salinisphaera sp. SWV1]|uniref:DsbE family thiol:disulfide interchange protein n=1 Tax=Salinisphaera sp. SWV1 TaxID=3454139 RepID=UPI003F8255B0
MRLRYLMPFVLVIGLVAIFWVGLHRDPRLVPSPLIGKPAPAFSLTALKQASSHVTGQRLKGQVSLVNVWASWCVSCREESPVLMALARQHVVPIIGLDYKDQRAQALKWLKTHGDPYSVVAFDASGNVGINWGVYGVPETFVVDKQGVIRLKHVGPLTRKVIQQQILPLVAKLQAAS